MNRGGDPSGKLVELAPTTLELLVFALEYRERARFGSDLVGRDDDLDALTRELSAPEAEGRICLLSGDAGIGKTRLLEELAERARAAQVRRSVRVPRTSRDRGGLPRRRDRRGRSSCRPTVAMRRRRSFPG